ncbi:hypothetical protein [Kitasatospora sp. KL5]|uniref:hypothetical protein n=1 Tax=Kitasatospora sp. KL5 TaxID=3425125 RepID=UPI003D6F0443
MVDETGGEPEPMVWALVVREREDGETAAEVIVEVTRDRHADLVGDAVDSGFVLAAGNAPDTTAVVELHEGLVERLVLVGGRQAWEPQPQPVASGTWRAAAEHRGRVLVVIVPPGTWPTGTPGPAGQERMETFAAALEDARAQGAALHGTAALRTS